MENRILKNDAQSFLHLAKQRDKAERMNRFFAQRAGTEEVSRREENVKYFDMGMNRRQAVVYSEPVHFRNADGEAWQEIDNTLEEAVTAQGRQVLRNRANRMRVEFPVQMDGGDMASMTENGRTFAWRLEQAAQPAAAKARTGAELKQERLVKLAQRMPKFVGRTAESLRAADLSAEIETEQERRGDIAQLKAENVYENVLPGLSVRYTVTSDRLKEDLILANAAALESAVLRLPKGFGYEVAPDQSLRILDRQTGDLAFQMDAPYVYDANGNDTIASVALSDCGEYVRLAYALDEAFLAKAAFPVTIDPVIHSSGAITNIQDTTLGEGQSFTPYTEDHMKVGKFSGSVRCVGLLKFNALAIPRASDAVISAVLQIAPKSSSSSKYIGAYEVLKPWESATVNWLNFNPDDASNVSPDALECVKGSSNMWLNFDLTNLYRKWCTRNESGVSNNNGVAFRTPANISGDNYSELYSSDASSAYRPVMYVNYVSHAGLEDWWQYEQMSAGRAGTAYADLFNGNMVLEHADTVMTGNRNPVSVNHYYNSCRCGDNNYGSGCGWKTDAHQKITALTLNDTNYYVWEDGDGTEHFFEYTGGSGPFKDAEGMELELRIDMSAMQITITDKQDNVMTFKIPNADSRDKGFTLALSLKKASDGEWINPVAYPFNGEWVGWQQSCYATAAGADYTQIALYILYTGNCNKAKFTNIFLHREAYGTTFGYDDDGNVLSISNLAGQHSKSTYDSEDNEQTYIQPGREDKAENQYWAYYGDSAAERKKHLPWRTRTPMNVTQYFSYDSYGNQTSSRQVDYRVFTGGAAESTYPYVRTENTYTTDGNYTATTKDARGNVVTQSVNANDGTLSSVTDPTGQTVNYTYDASRRVTAVQTTGDGKTYRNAYTYENDRIKTVSHNTASDTANDVTYTFDYDGLGRKTTVKVGTQTLSANVYESDRSGLLSEVQYGNGGKVKYAYDGFDRLTEVKYDAETAPRYEYKYGANGEAAEVVDHELNRTARTDYDQADRPCQTELRDDATGEALYKTGLKYNKLNQLEMFSEQAGGETHKTEFAYDRDNRVTGITYDGGAHKVNYTYDELGRVASRVAECGADAGKLTSTYEYVDGGYGTNSTTPLVKKITQNGISFEYEYDSRGNITSEKRGDLTTTYQYDALGQLIRVNDPHENATWVYSYDRGGNILSKVKYAYTTDAVGTAIETIPYVYGDNNWKDKLTSYNGQTITYDAIGNPLNDGTWTYTWQAGRQLKQMSAEGTSVSFKYDHNGMRVQKVVEQSWYPEITNYTYHGKILTHMTVDYTDFDEVAHQDEMHFFYDAQSRPVKVEFNGTVYTYLPNLQGDIVGIIDSNGSLVVEYKYDAWGKPLSTTGTLAGTLGKRNPFRYRGYVYDEETEFYCLTNRYYNVGWKRFINPDDLFAANLFMYGQNNPISFDDPSGNLARNAIHNAVQRDLRRRYPALISEVAVIKGSGGAGRIDLLNQYTGQIWEIKPNTRPSYYANGAAQLRNYARGRLLNYPKLRMRIGGPLKAGMFIYHVGRDIASVKYWYAGAGVILYSYKILRKGEPSKSTIPVPYSDRQEKDDSNSNPQTNIIPFPVQNEGQDETIAAIATVCVVAIVLVGASCLTGIPFWTVFAF